MAVQKMNKGEGTRECEGKKEETHTRLTGGRRRYNLLTVRSRKGGGVLQHSYKEGKLILY